MIDKNVEYDMKTFVKDLNEYGEKLIKYHYKNGLMRFLIWLFGKKPKEPQRKDYIIKNEIRK